MKTNRKFEVIRKFNDEETPFDREVLITKEMFEDLYDLREFCCQESETEDEIESKKWLSYETTLGHIINHTQTMDGLHPQYNGHIFPIWLHPDFRMDSEFGEYLRENMCLVNTPLGDKELGVFARKKGKNE
jgi:hypothetical protein